MVSIGVQACGPVVDRGEERADRDGVLELNSPFGLLSVGSCCSTGKKLHSFFNRIQFEHLPAGSS